MLSTYRSALLAPRLTRFSVRFCATFSHPKGARMAVQQPVWKLPERRAEEPVLKVYNSLTRTKVSLLQPGSDLHPDVDLRLSLFLPTDAS